MEHARKKLTKADFYYENMTHSQFVDMIDREFPISLKYNANLINRIQARYPILTKSQIAIIVKALFLAIRRIILMGDYLTIYGLVIQLHMFLYYWKDLLCVKMRYITDHILRKK